MGLMFDMVREEVTALDAARFYGLIEGRKKVALCPWHDDHAPSLHFNERNGKCFCFACNNGGSSIDLVAKIFDIEPLEAAKKLNADFKLCLDDSPSAPPAGESKAQKRKRYEDWRKLRYKILTDTLHYLKRKIENYAPDDGEDKLRKWLFDKEDCVGRLELLDSITFEVWERDWDIQGIPDAG